MSCRCNSGKASIHTSCFQLSDEITRQMTARSVITRAREGDHFGIDGNGIDKVRWRQAPSPSAPTTISPPPVDIARARKQEGRICGLRVPADHDASDGRTARMPDNDDSRSAVVDPKLVDGGCDCVNVLRRVMIPPSKGLTRRLPTLAIAISWPQKRDDDGSRIVFGDPRRGRVHVVGWPAVADIAVQQNDEIRIRDRLDRRKGPSAETQVAR